MASAAAARSLRLFHPRGLVSSPIGSLASVPRSSTFVRVTPLVTSTQPRSLATSSSQCGQLYYTKKHEWVTVEAGVGTVGISNYAQEALGDIVYAQLPEPDSEVTSGEECGALESVKAASEVYSPVSGIIVQKNEKVEAAPALINSSPTEEGWLFKVKLGAKAEAEIKALLSEDKYKEFLKTQEDHH